MRLFYYLNGENELIKRISMTTGQFTSLIHSSVDDEKNIMPTLILIISMFGRINWRRFSKEVKISTEMLHGGLFPSLNEGQCLFVGSVSIL